MSETGRGVRIVDRVPMALIETNCSECGGELDAVGARDGEYLFACRRCDRKVYVK
ncbi:MAG TPA: hypothetical protein VF377_10395 [Acidimicrobiia bacterium]